jgi:hypothetical protein
MKKIRRGKLIPEAALHLEGFRLQGSEWKIEPKKKK